MKCLTRKSSSLSVYCWTSSLSKPFVTPTVINHSLNTKHDKHYITSVNEMLPYVR